jgi:DNA-binding CsgD family transcriptional regulator
MRLSRALAITAGLPLGNTRIEPASASGYIQQRSRLPFGYAGTYASPRAAHARAGMTNNRSGSPGSAPITQSVPLSALYRHVGERLLAAGSPTGERLLGAAIEFFAGAGIQPPADAARALLRAAGRPVPRRGRGRATVPARLAAAGVSSREMDVLVLLAEGLTNRQIAARLYLSPRTVEKHVERLLAKTHSPNRVALAAHAASAALPLST